tara:strand:+ start:1190 stop:1381 length:192 start_codon:yes stop_codon:yes gene_type:complete
MLVQTLTFIGAVMFSLGFIVLLHGAALIVGDKQRAYNKRKEELVSGGKPNGDDTRRKSKKENS